MTYTVIITLSVLVLVAYVFDLTSSKTKIPAVILLLLLGWVLKQVTIYLGIKITDLSPALPVLGTIGLILIVLEGSLELELDRSKSALILKSFFIALIPMVGLAFGLAYLLEYFGFPDIRKNLLNVIPICIISSAIAIPSVRGLSRLNKEFIIYESSLSDVLGLMLFNFVAINDHFNFRTLGDFTLQLLLIIAISFIATIGLAILLNKIGHHIKFIPIILLLLLIYAVSEVYHLPGLIFILFFGLFIGNIDQLRNIKWIEKLKPDELNKEVSKFKDLTSEASFLIRSVFFLMFGFLIDTSALLNIEISLWAVGITAGIFAMRAILLKLFRLPLSPLLFISPRGLITILLILSIKPADAISIISLPLILQIVIIMALMMMVGLMTDKTNRQKIQ